MKFEKFKEVINNIDPKEDYEVTAYCTEDVLQFKNYEGEIILSINLFEETLIYKL